MNHVSDAAPAKAPEGLDSVGEATNESQAVHPSGHRRAWDDAPVRVKVSLLAVAATIWGTVVGLGAATLGHHALGAMLGAGLVALVASWLGRKWIAHPVEDLVHQLSRITRPQRPLSTGSLPRGRTDEVGQVARAVHQISVAALRDRQEASSLRRTLDDRIAKATRRATAELSQLAMRDALTGLGNRRFLDEHLDPLVETCRASSTDLVCVMIDVDEFKQVNDTLGHGAGDELLKFAAQMIRASSRENDYVVRLGGDEFVVFMPGCDLERAEHFAERTIALFREHIRLTMPDIGEQVGLSVGIAALNRDGARSGTELLEVADAHLYLAKQQGKGRAMGL